MTDTIIDTKTVHRLQSSAVHSNVPVTWIVQRDLLEHPGKYVARLATTHPTLYVMVADSLAELEIMLPPALIRSEPRASDPSNVVEIWFSR